MPINPELFRLEQGRLWPAEPTEQKIASKAPQAVQSSLWDGYLKATGTSLDKYRGGYLKGLPELPGYRPGRGRPVVASYSMGPKVPVVVTPAVIELPGAREGKSVQKKYIKGRRQK